MGTLVRCGLRSCSHCVQDDGEWRVTFFQLLALMWEQRNGVVMVSNFCAGRSIVGNNQRKLH
jgi:hypothetical protein